MLSLHGLELCVEPSFIYSASFQDLFLESESRSFNYMCLQYCVFSSQHFCDEVSVFVYFCTRGNLGDVFLYMDVTMEDYFVNLASFISSGNNHRAEMAPGSSG